MLSLVISIPFIALPSTHTALQLKPSRPPLLPCRRNISFPANWYPRNFHFCPLQTRLTEVKDTKYADKEHPGKKEITGAKKGIEAKEEDSDKSKRSASHLIAFFSKNKDKDKENTKEKDKDKSKSKDKEKGRSTPPPGKQTSEGKSTGGKLERKGSTGSTASPKAEGKSWRKSLGILGGGSKHDKEEKHKKNSDHRASYPGDMSGKNPQVITSKQEGSAVKTVKDNKEEKAKRKHPERRSSNPMAEVLLKDSQVVEKLDNNALETVPENKDEKSRKRHPERRTSSPITELQKIGKDDKDEQSNRKQPERRSSNPSADSQTKNSYVRPVKHDEAALNTVKEEKTSDKTQPNHQTRAKTNTSVSSEKAIKLREKKGRVTSEERREKAKSLGDLSSNLHKVEVSILDPTVPPSRTVDTMDIPNQLGNSSKRPMSSNAILETPPLASKRRENKDRNAFEDNEDVKGDSKTLKESSTAAEVLLNGGSAEHKITLDQTSVLSSKVSGNEGVAVQETSLEKKAIGSDLNTSKATSPVKYARNGTASSFMTDISELSAELSAAIASPPPQPIRLSMSETNLLSTSPPTGNRRSPVGKDHGT